MQNVERSARMSLFTKYANMFVHISPASAPPPHHHINTNLRLTTTYLHTFVGHQNTPPSPSHFRSSYLTSCFKLLRKAARSIQPKVTRITLTVQSAYLPLPSTNLSSPPHHHHSSHSGQKRTTTTTTNGQCIHQSQPFSFVFPYSSRNVCHCGATRQGNSYDINHTNEGLFFFSSTSNSCSSVECACCPVTLINMDDGTRGRLVPPSMAVGRWMIMLGRAWIRLVCKGVVVDCLMAFEGYHFYLSLGFLYY